MHTQLIPQPGDDMLTLSELRTIPGFEQVSDEEGQALLETIYSFCAIAFSVHAKSEKSPLEIR